MTILLEDKSLNDNNKILLDWLWCFKKNVTLYLFQFLKTVVSSERTNFFFIKLTVFLFFIFSVAQDILYLSKSFFNSNRIFTYVHISNTVECYQLGWRFTIS